MGKKHRDILHFSLLLFPEKSGSIVLILFERKW